MENSYEEKPEVKKYVGLVKAVKDGVVLATLRDLAGRIIEADLPVSRIKANERKRIMPYDILVIELREQEFKAEIYYPI